MYMYYLYRSELEGKQWFSHIGELRLLFPKHYIACIECYVYQTNIKKSFENSPTWHRHTEIRISPNRDDIKVVVNKIPNTTAGFIG